MLNYIHFDSLLEEGKDLFINLKDQWGPAKAVAPVNAMVSAVDKLTARVAQLDQQLKAKGNNNGNNNGNGDKKGNGNGLKCFKCGKPGFTKKTCPDCNKDSNGKDGTKQPGKWAAPKDGEPTEKMIDGVLMKYCAKCRRGKGRWTNDHTTAEHKSGFLKDNKKSDSDGDKPAGNVASLPIGTSQDLFSAWSDVVQG